MKKLTKSIVGCVVLAIALALGACQPQQSEESEQAEKPEKTQGAGKASEAEKGQGEAPDESTAEQGAEGAEGAAEGQPEPKAQLEGIPETQIGLAPGTIFDTPVPEVTPANPMSRDDAEAKPRPFVGAPPVIPHTIADLDPITKDSNPCLECHDSLPDSHLTDLRNAPEKVGESVAGARYVCVSCHVSQHPVSPLVVNTQGK